MQFLKSIKAIGKAIWAGIKFLCCCGSGSGDEVDERRKRGERVKEKYGYVSQVSSPPASPRSSYRAEPSFQGFAGASQDLLEEQQGRADRWNRAEQSAVKTVTQIGALPKQALDRGVTGGVKKEGSGWTAHLGFGKAKLS